MTTRTDRPSAPPGVLIDNTSSSTGSATVGPPAHEGTGSGASGAPPVPRSLPRPLHPRDVGWTDVGLLVASAVSSLCLVWVVFFQLTLLSGAFGFLVCWYGVFLALTWISTAQVVERQVATDRVVAAVVVTAAALIVGIVVFIVVWVAYKAVPSIHWGALFSHDQKALLASDPQVLNRVGVLHAIIGTLEQVALATVIGVPIAIATAVFLNEVGGRGVRTVRTVVTAMSGTPSIVAGVFVYSILIINHVLTFSGFAAALALVVVLLPSVTRVIEEVLRLVPSGLREASLALGAPQWRTVWSVVLPTARSGVVTGILLGVARIVGETAPLLFTAFGSQLVNSNAFSQPQSALPLSIWTNVRAAQPILIEIGFQAAFVLMSVVLVLFVAARVFSRTRGKKSVRLRSEDDTLARMFVPVPMESEESR